MIHLTGTEDQVLYIANDTEIRSFVYPYNQSHGHKLLTHIEDNARIIGMDVLSHPQKFIWATQFNPGGIFYKDSFERSQTKSNVRNIVSIYILLLYLHEHVASVGSFLCLLKRGYDVKKKKSFMLLKSCVFHETRIYVSEYTGDEFRHWHSPLLIAVFRLPSSQRYFCWLDHRQHLLDRSLSDALVQLLHGPLDEITIFNKCGPT